MLGHQLGDERLLPDAGQVVGGRILHREEVPAEAFPERALAVGVEPAAQLGDDLGREALGELGDEQEAALREQRAVLAVPVRLVEEQRAELGVAGVVVGEEQRRRRRVDAERARRVHERADVVVVPGLLASPTAASIALMPTTRSLAPRPALHEHEHVARVGASAPPANDASERSMRSARRSRLAGSVVRPVPVRSDSARTAGRSSRAIGRT